MMVGIFDVDQSPRCRHMAGYAASQGKTDFRTRLKATYYPKVISIASYLNSPVRQNLSVKHLGYQLLLLPVNKKQRAPLGAGQLAGLGHDLTEKNANVI